MNQICPGGAKVSAATLYLPPSPTTICTRGSLANDQWVYFTINVHLRVCVCGHICGVCVCVCVCMCVCVCVCVYIILCVYVPVHVCMLVWCPVTTAMHV